MRLVVCPTDGYAAKQALRAPGAATRPRPRPAVRLLLLACALFLASLAARGQNVQFTQGAVGSGLDHAIQIPIAAYPGRGGANLPVTLYYSSRVWRVGYIKTVHDGALPQSVAEAIYAEHSTAGWTTSLDIPRVEWPRANDLYWYDGKAYHNSVPPYTYRVANVFIHMPDGSRHELRKQDQVYADNGTVDKFGTFYAVDGSRLRYDSTGATTGTLYMPDGSRYELNGSTAIFIDRNGNALNYDAAARQWTDTLGRVVGTPWPASPQAGQDYSYTPPGYSSPFVFKWRSLSSALTPDAQGQTPALKAQSSHYLPNPAATPTNNGSGNFPQPSNLSSLFFSDYGDDAADNPALTYTYLVGRGQTAGQLFDPVVLAEVVLPNGLSYKFSYNLYGEMDKVVYPTGGYQRSQYGEVSSTGEMKPPYKQGSRGVKFRWVSPNGTGGTDEAKWTYEGGGSFVRVIAPDNTRTESYRHSFNPLGRNFGYTDSRNGLVYDERVFNSGGAMLSRTLTEWAQTSRGYTGPPTPCCNISRTNYTAYRNPRPVKTVSLMLDTGGAALAKTATYDYDTTFEMTTGLDRTGVAETHFASVDQSTAQTGAMSLIPAGPAASSSVTVYQNGPAYIGRYILGLVSSVTLNDADGLPVTMTETFYDEPGYPLVNYPDLAGDPNYIDPGSTAVRGNPTTVRRYTDLAAGTYLDTSAQYDQCGNSVNYWDVRSIQSEREFSAAYKHAFVTKTTIAAPDPTGLHGSAAAFVTTNTYDPATGQVLTETNPNQQTTYFSYGDQGVPDPLNRLRKVTRPDGGWTRTSYNDVVGNSFVHVETKFDAATSTHSYQFYDKMGRASRSFVRESGLTFVVAESRYDNMGRVSQSSNPFRTTVSGTGDPAQAPYWVTADQPSYWTANEYDALGRTRLITLPDLTTVTTEFTGVYTTVTDQAGRKRRQKTDALGRVVRVDEPDANGNLDGGDKNSPYQPSFYEYDTQGNLVGIHQGLTQAGANPEVATNYAQHRHFRFDAMSRLTFERQPEQDATIPDPVTGQPTWSRRLAYDETIGGVSYKGQLTTAEDARRVVTRYAYDRMGRPFEATYTDGTPTLKSYYDQERNGYFNVGKLTELTTTATANAPQTSQVYDYDEMGHVVRQQQIVDANTYNLSYAYNLGGVLTSQTYPSGRVVNYGFDAAARLLSVSSGATAYAAQMTYKPFGGLQSMALGNGTTYSMAYNDARLHLSSITLTQGSATVQRYDYKYGQVNAATGDVDETKNDGQIARIEGTIGTQRQWQQRFTYDSLGRLSAAGEYRGDTLQQTYLLNYDYDVYGNRFQKQSRNPGNPFPQPWVEDGSFNGATNRFTSGLTYDPAGNIAADARFRQRAFQYDAHNRQRQSSNLDGSGAVNSVFDGVGQRVATKVGANLTNVMVYDASGDLVAEYSGAVANNGTRYIIGDHQGSARVVMSGGTVVARHDYRPFGEDLAAGTGMRTGAQGYSQPDDLRKQYAGMERDEFTGMSHTLWREFDNMSARWTAPDPYGGSMSLSSPQSFNRYTYVNNDPVNQTDPAGLMAASEGWGSVSSNFWGGNPGFFDPHFGGPGIIAEAMAKFDSDLADTMFAARINDLIKKGLITEQQARDMIDGNENLSLSSESAAQPERRAASQQESGAEAPAEGEGARAEQRRPSKTTVEKWKSQLEADIEFDRDAAAAYAKAGETAKSVAELEKMVDEILTPKYGKPKIAGYTTADGKSKVKKDPNPYRVKATAVHEKVHREAAREGIAKYGKGTKDFNRWWNDPKRFAANEVKAYTADIEYMQRVLQQLNR
ncbi:MAG TPA: RHS repeat-associated core domain-containing protein [Pyrinomonadaceae bacterium]